MNVHAYQYDLLSEANKKALSCLTSVKPSWNGIVRVSEVIGTQRRCLFHAGPAYPDFSQIPTPVRNSLIFGCIYEGWAKDRTSAEKALADQVIEILPAQDFDFLVPLAGVISPSMAAVRVVDTATDRVKYCVLNEGAEIATRLGRCDDRLLDHHKWLNGDLSDWLTACLDKPIDLLPIMLKSFAEGDDGHAQTAAASRLISTKLRQSAFDTPDRITTFLDTSSAFALNIWMAAAALMLSAAEGISGSTLVTRAGGNGYQFGYSIAGDPETWLISDNVMPMGAIEIRFNGKIPVNAVGDSAVIDFLGLGGQNLATAPALSAALQDYLPADVYDRGVAILGTKHDKLGERMVGCLAERAAQYGHGPIVLIGMIDADGEAGRIGGGVVDVPGSIFKINMLA